MPASSSTSAAQDLPRQRMGAVHAIALSIVWFAFAVSGIVFIEPAPVDAMMFGLLLMLPILGLIRITPPLMLYLTIWLVAAASAIIGTLGAADTKVAITHALVTVFLTLTSFIVSAFVMRRPQKHVHLIFHGYVFAAGIAALAALAGYFRLFPGAYDLFTRFDRASGTFKDPNVLGAFLVPPLVFLLHRMLTRGGLRFLWAALWVGIIGLAVLFTFSRGAWINLSVSVTIFGYLAFLTAPTNLQRLKILAAGLGAVCGAFMLLVVALQIPGVGNQLASRATMDQSYDQGPEGRFGGQQKAMRLIIDHPFGVGPQNFAPKYHMEEPHNVYLFSFLNAGWLGGLIFVIMVAVTIVYGLRHAFKRTSTQPMFIVALSCFIALAGEGLIIDLDHWRHFHLLMALVWGMMLGDREIQSRGALLFDPRQVFRNAEMIVTSRPPRPLIEAPALATAQPAAARFVRRVETQRRDMGRADSRPSRAEGRTFARRVPD
jgi:O-antigen ligase